MSRPRAHAHLPLHVALSFTLPASTAGTYSWSATQVRAAVLSLGESGDADHNLAPLPANVMWRTRSLRLAFPDRQYLLVWVQEASCFFFFFFFFFFKFLFFVSNLTSTRKFILCPFHRHLKHQHCIYSYVTEWQLLWRKWSHAFRPSLPLAGQITQQNMILISTFLFFTFIGRSCQSLLPILFQNP